MLKGSKDERSFQEKGRKERETTNISNNLWFLGWNSLYVTFVNF